MRSQDDAGSAAPDPPHAPRALAIDLGASRLRAAAVAAGGEVLRRRETPTPRDGSPRALVGAVIDLLSALAADLPADSLARLAGIGVSAVGPLDAERGVLLGPPNLGAGYRGLELAAPLRGHFGLPVAIERDTNVAALAERAFGAARGCDDFVYLTVSTGIGGGIVHDGRIFGGSRGLAGELGHVPVSLAGPACGCGRPGHLEAFASGSGIARRAHEAVEAGAGGALARLQAEAGEEFGAADVVAAEEQGDGVAATILDEAVAAFASATLGFVNAFDPQLIVVGGGVMTGLGGRLLAAAQQAVEESALAPPARKTEIVAAALGDDCSLIGCLPLAAGEAVGAGAATAPRLGQRAGA
jgi:glucokinase